MLRYATRCYAMLCDAMPYHAIPCHTMPYHAMPYYAALHKAMLRYATLSSDILGVLYHVVQRGAMLCYVMFCSDLLSYPLLYSAIREKKDQHLNNFLRRVDFRKRGRAPKKNPEQTVQTPWNVQDLGALTGLESRPRLVLGALSCVPA